MAEQENQPIGEVAENEDIAQTELAKSAVNLTGEQPKISEIDKNAARISDLVEEENRIKADTKVAKEHLAGDMRSMKEVSIEISDVSAEALMMKQVVEESLEKQGQNSEDQQEALGVPNEAGEIEEQQSAVWGAKQLLLDIQQGEEALREAREEAMNEWILSSIDYCLKWAPWRKVLDNCENRIDAETMIKKKLELYIRKNTGAFLEGDSEYLPGWEGQMSTKTVDTQEGKKTWVTKIDFVPYSGPSSVEEEDQGENESFGNNTETGSIEGVVNGAQGEDIPEIA
ncbi:MAG: hypothetical protein Q7S53_00960 [bacterium]|nr:hypothetical protein [bacterium]